MWRDQVRRRQPAASDLEQLIEIAARDSGENPGLPPEWKREVPDRGEVEP